jgi:cephalosporin hydroxylase
MSELREIFDNTLNHPSDKWESYFGVYERHLKDFRDREFNLIEVGVQKGGSLDMWANYFPKANIITGIDIDTECANLKYGDPRINVVIGDQGDPAFWDKFLETNTKIDVFIDDGGHFMGQQILTFEKIFPILSIGGVFICEDCHTSYMNYNGGGLERKGSFIEYAKSYIDVIHWEWKEQYTTSLEAKYKIGKDLTSIHFYDSMVVFEKFGKKEMKRVEPNL